MPSAVDAHRSSRQRLPVVRRARDRVRPRRQLDAGDRRGASRRRRRSSTLHQPPLAPTLILPVPAEPRAGARRAGALARRAAATLAAQRDVEVLLLVRRADERERSGRA